MWSSLVNFVSQLMGNQFGQFCHALKQGQCNKAEDMYFNTKKLREAILLKVNEPLGPDHDHNSVLHYVAQHKMQRMYMELLNSDRCPGVPDLKNGHRRNCFHLICLNDTNSHAALSMLEFTVEFLRRQKVDVAHLLAEKDKDGNTALHLAAAVGLIDCVDLLVSHNADMYATNTKEETAADVATRTNHKEIATKLETQMVFSNDPGNLVAADPDPELLQELADQPTGMQDTELRSMKDQLLIETSEMLGVSLFTAEALLRNHGWSKEDLLEAWMRNPEDVCEKAGVQLPVSLGVHNLLEDGPGGRGDRGQVTSVDPQTEWECGICCVPSAVEVQVPCEHHFCKDCWKEYLEGKIKAGEAHSILCPEYGCYKLVPLDVIESVVSREMAQRFLNFDIKAFVDSNPNIRWCPAPGCGQAVALTAPTEDPFDPLLVDGDFGNVKQRKGRVAHCGKQHYFCWDCMGEAHEPCSCEEWKKWLELIEEMRPKVGDKTSAESDEAASFRWLASRSKPCPKCQAPIEKTEGCNHMCCKKCKHDFCWVCLDNWGCHNSSTGGYFECNRYDAQKKAHELLIQRKDKINAEYAEIERMGKFLHYFERYKGHGQSLGLEEPFLGKAHHKMELLAASVQSLEQSGSASMPRNRANSSAVLGARISTEFMSFIEEAVKELLKDRRVLRASYGFGYFIQSKVAQRQFENMQGALEQVTEYLAEVVARPHLRKPRQEIIRLTREAREKRHHLIRQVHIGLPDLTPPTLPPRRSTFPWNGGALMDDMHSPPSADFMRWLQNERERRSPSPSPPVPRNSLLGANRERRSLPNRSRWNRNRSREEDRGLRHILEMSRMEYEADQRLNKDLETAKALSMQEQQPVSPASPNGSYEEIGDRDSVDSLTPLHSVSSWLNIPSESEATNWVDHSYPTRNVSPPPPSWPTWNLERTTSRDEATNMEHLLPPRTIPRTRSALPPRTIPRAQRTLPTRASLDYSPTANGDPVGLRLVSPLRAVPSPVRSPGPSPEQLSPEVTDTNAISVEGNSEWGPLYGEDEDLRRAIRLSMADIREGADHEHLQMDQSGLSIHGTQFLGYNTPFDDGGLSGTRGRETSGTDHMTHEITLPPELRHLLETSSRTGAHV